MKYTAGSLETAIRDSKTWRTETGRTDPSTPPWLRKDSKTKGPRSTRPETNHDNIGCSTGLCVAADPFLLVDDGLNNGSLMPRSFDGMGFGFLYDFTEENFLPTPNVRELIASVGTGNCSRLSDEIGFSAGPGNAAVQAILSRAGRSL